MTDINYIVLNNVGQKDEWVAVHDLEEACRYFNGYWNATKPHYDTVTIAAVLKSTEYDRHPLLNSLKPALDEQLDPAFTGENQMKTNDRHQMIFRIADYLRQPTVDKYDLTLWNALGFSTGKIGTFFGDASDLNESFLYGADILRNEPDNECNFYYYNMGFINGTGRGLDSLAQQVIHKWDEEEG